MFDIDVHIIRYNEPDWMMDRCISSLSEQPVNIYIVQGELEAPPVNGRTKGFSMGTAKYCSLVDPDDIVLPGAYEEMLEYPQFDLVHGNEYIIKDGVCVGENKGIHHAFIVKRDAHVTDFSRGHVGLIIDACKKRITTKHINKAFYTWNMSAGNFYNKKERLYEPR